MLALFSVADSRQAHSGWIIHTVCAGGSATV